ncbi:MAG: very short patch repair endonuclease, partial [Lachnospiraceae bacterium]|nr:very short patch repair endonuclease [Lachnospiraceae bacterium]
PDIVLPKYKTCVFVNGCFWHKHENCKYFTWPKNNAEFWRTKIEKNVSRDSCNYDTLKAQGWRIIVIWECQLKKTARDQTLNYLIRELNSVEAVKASAQ